MIIGLTGYAQSGKDTVASILVSKHGFTRVAFADKIREFLYEVNPMVGCSPSGYLKDLVELVGWDAAKQEPQVRRLLQDLGVGARKVFGEEFWIAEALKTIDLSSNVVITDVRFTNEADNINLWGQFSGNPAQIWRIKRTGVAAVNSHVSEHDLDNYPVNQIFANNGSIEDLELLVTTRVQGLLV